MRFTQLQQPIRLKRKYHCVIFSSAIPRKRNEKLVFTKSSNGEGNYELWYFAIIIANVYKETLHFNLLFAYSQRLFFVILLVGMQSSFI